MILLLNQYHPNTISEIKISAVSNTINPVIYVVILFKQIM